MPISGRLLAIALTLFASVYAQETTGSIEGTATDPSGAAVPGAAVEISGSNLVRSQSTTTDRSGYYILTQLPPGSYTVAVSAKGFVNFKQEGVNLLVGRNLRIDPRLQVGSLSETVVVNAEALQIDTTQTTISQDVTKDFFDRMPKGRSYDSLIALAPGARVEPKSGQFQIDGSSGSENVFYIDGIDQTNIQTGTNPRQAQIPFEFLNEFQVRSSGFEAQYGGATGGVVSAVVRSGSNAFHGDAWYYAANDGLNAGPRPTLRLDPNNDNIANYFRNTRDGYNLVNPGGDIGGFLLRDKLWFFAAYDARRDLFERRVKFLSNGSTRTLHEEDRTDRVAVKLDFAPFQKLRISTTYLYDPFVQNGVLPTQQGTGNANTDYRSIGSRTPASSYLGSADYTATNRLIFSFRGGYNYQNYKDYGIPRGTYLRYITSTTGIPNVPPQFQGPAGQFTPANSQTVFDINERKNFSADVSYIVNLAGQHSFRGGWATNRLHNSVFNGYPDGYFRIGFGRALAGVTVPGKVQGTYGYIVDRSSLATTGDVGSNNDGFYFQDSWRASKRLTLNLGIRFEHEFVPSFTSGKNADGLNYSSKVIDFGWGSKVAPRLGFAYDLFGNGKFKIAGSYGKFYDTMKYSLPRGSFGGDKWKDYVYPLNGTDLSTLKPGQAPFGAPLFEVVDYRIPSNDPSQPLVDPNIKPFSVHAWDFEAEYQLTSNTVVTSRYTRRRVDKAIEDVGLLLAAGETYFIGNPGYGVTIDPKNFSGGIPPTPKAQRDYDGIEFRVDRRFSRNFIYAVSYTYSRLYGNYAGLANSDEATTGAGRLGPNNNRAFDLPFVNYDSHGKPEFGPLATDRPHALKTFISYTQHSKLGETTLAPIFDLASGTPLTTEVAVFSINAYPNNRGDLGRTPVYMNTNLLLQHEFVLPRLREGMKIHLEANVTNIFNQNIITDRYVQFTHPNDGGIQYAKQSDYFTGLDYKALMAAQGIRQDPQFGQALFFSAPRSMRFGVKFIF